MSATLMQNKKSCKSKRVRTIFTPEQLERLEAEFERQQYMVGPERLYLAHTLQLTEAQVSSEVFILFNVQLKRKTLKSILFQFTPLHYPIQVNHLKFLTYKKIADKILKLTVHNILRVSRFSLKSHTRIYRYMLYLFLLLTCFATTCGASSKH